MDDLIAFLRARWDEEARNHTHTRDECMECGSDWPCFPMREIEAKRQLLAWLERTQEWAASNNLWTYDEAEPLRILALPYADHPDYQERWAPASH